MDATAVRNIAVFAGFDESQCTRIAGACQELDVEEGTRLTEAGDFGWRGGSEGQDGDFPEIIQEAMRMGGK